MKKQWIALATLLTMSVVNIMGGGSAAAEGVFTPKKIENIEFKTEVGTQFEDSFLKELEVRANEKAVFRTELQLDGGEGTDLIFAERKTGDGTIENPIPIYTIADLMAIGKDEESLTKSYILMNNIDMGSYTEERPWLPIGYKKETPFSGTFNGNHYALLNLKDSGYDNKENTGLFYRLEGADIVNLVLKGFEITMVDGLYGFGAVTAWAIDSSIRGCTIVDSEFLSQDAMGGFVYSGERCVFENCSVINTKMTMYYLVSGIVGYADACVLRNCDVQSSVFESSQWGTGGLVSRATTSLKMVNCSTSADTTLKGMHRAVGLVTSAAGSIEIIDCINRALLYSEEGTSGGTTMAGIVGTVSGDNVRIERCANLGDLNICHTKETDTTYGLPSGFFPIYNVSGIYIGQPNVVKDCLNAGNIVIVDRAIGSGTYATYNVAGIGYSRTFDEPVSTVMSNCISAGTIDLSKIERVDMNCYAAGILMGYGTVKDSVFAGTLTPSSIAYDGDLIARIPFEAEENGPFGPHTDNFYVAHSDMTSEHGEEITASAAREAATYSAFDMAKVWTQGANEIPHLKLQDTQGFNTVPKLSANTTYGVNPVFVETSFAGTKVEAMKLLDPNAIPLCDTAEFYKYLQPGTSWQFYYQANALSQGQHTYEVKMTSATGESVTDSALVRVIASETEPTPEPEITPAPDTTPIPDPPVPGGPLNPLPPTAGTYDFAMEMWVYAVDNKLISTTAANTQPQAVNGTVKANLELADTLGNIRLRSPLSAQTQLVNRAEAEKGFKQSLTQLSGSTLAYQNTTQAQPNMVEVTMGNVVTYHLRVDNKGTQPAIPARIVDKPHAGMKFEQADNPEWKLRADGLIELSSKDVIQPSTSKTYALKLRIDTNEEGLMVNRARIAHMTDAKHNPVQDINSPVGEDLDGDVYGLNNVCVAVLFNRKSNAVTYDLSIQKWVTAVNGKATNLTGTESNVQPIQVKQGDRIVYSMRVTNKGDAAAIPGKIIDKMPAGMSFSTKINTGWRQREDGSLELKVNDILQPKESKVYTVALTVASDEKKSFTNLAYIESMTDAKGNGVTNSSSQNGGKTDADKNNIAVITTQEYEDMYKTGESVPLPLIMGIGLLVCASVFSVMYYRKRKLVEESF